MEFKKVNKKKYIATIIAAIALGKIGYEAFDKTSLVIDLINLGLNKKASIEAKKEENYNQEEEEEYRYVDDSRRYAMAGDGEIKLNEKYEKDYIVKDNKLYITANKGETWVQAPECFEPGAAVITNYLNEITANNIVISNGEVSIVYGGRGTDNITVISGNINGYAWSIDTLGLTATRNHQEGYDNMYIDFVDGGQTGYMLIKKGEENIVYKSVNSGVTWDDATSYEDDYEIITSHFENK